MRLGGRSCCGVLYTAPLQPLRPSTGPANLLPAAVWKGCHCSRCADILYYSPEFLALDLKAALAQVAAAPRFPIAVKNNNKLYTEIDSKIPEFLIGDKLRLSQVFMNLVSNALKFTKDGSVTVCAKLARIEGSKHYLYFEVKDTGVGIAKEDQEKIFEKFVQIERKEGDYQGTGLGLSIVQRLIELFGSKVHLESEEGKGTTFSFTLGFDRALRVATNCGG